MSNISTNIKQSINLAKLGLKSNDMWWTWVWNQQDLPKKEWRLVTRKMGVDDIPAWSLNALLDALPKDMACGVIFKPRYKQPNGRVITREWWTFCAFRDVVHYNESDNDQLTSVYNLVCYLLENNLIKKGE